MLGGLGYQEILVIGLLVGLLFGAKRLPALGAGIGKGFRDFKRGISGQIDDEEYDRIVADEANREEIDA